MIIFDADDPLVLNGTYDREGYKPGERARIEKARIRQLKFEQAQRERDGHVERTERSSSSGLASAETDASAAEGEG